LGTQDSTSKLQGQLAVDGGATEAESSPQGISGEPGSLSKFERSWVQDGEP